MTATFTCLNCGAPYPDGGWPAGKNRCRDHNPEFAEASTLPIEQRDAWLAAHSPAYRMVLAARRSKP